MISTVQFYMARPEERGFTAFLSCCSFSYPQLEAMKEQFLHEAELSYLASLAFEKRRFSYLLGRCAAKAAASAFMEGVDPRDIWIHRGIMNQPLVYSQRVSGPSSERLNPQVTISHSHGFGVAASFSEAHPLAVDLEWVDPRHEKAIWEHTTDHEKGVLASLSLDSIDRATLGWTVKEALSKVLHCGLSVPFKILEMQSIEVHGDVYISKFCNFAQYKAHSVRQGLFWFSLVLPIKSELQEAMAVMTAMLANQTQNNE